MPSHDEAPPSSTRASRPFAGHGEAGLEEGVDLGQRDLQPPERSTPARPTTGGVGRLRGHDRHAQAERPGEVVPGQREIAGRAARAKAPGAAEQRQEARARGAREGEARGRRLREGDLVATPCSPHADQRAEDLAIGRVGEAADALRGDLRRLPPARPLARRHPPLADLHDGARAERAAFEHVRDLELLCRRPSRAGHRPRGPRGPRIEDLLQTRGDLRIEGHAGAARAIHGDEVLA